MLAILYDFTLLMFFVWKSKDRSFYVIQHEIKTFLFFNFIFTKKFARIQFFFCTFGADLVKAISRHVRK